MTLPLDSLILGLTTGLTYALLAAGLVLIYKSSRFINFAHGQLGAFSAMLVAKLANDHGVQLLARVRRWRSASPSSSPAPSSSPSSAACSTCRVSC